MRIRNWEKYQHYKHRDPTWIKVYPSVLDDYEFCSLPDASKALAFVCLLLASRTKNKIPYDQQWLKDRGSLKKAPNIQSLIDIRFVEMIPASNMLAPCLQDASQMLTQSRVERKKERADDKDVVRDPEFRTRSLKADLGGILKRVKA
jgi:hypothetical protein